MTFHPNLLRCFSSNHRINNSLGSCIIMTDLDKAICIMEEATKHLSDGNSMLCAMAIGRAIATLDAYKNRHANVTSMSQLIYTDDPVPTHSVQYNTTKNNQYAYPPSVTCEPASSNLVNNVVVKETPAAVDDDIDDLSNITYDDLKEYSKMKKLMASMEVIDAMKGRISGFCSRVSEGVKSQFRNWRLPHTNLFITYS